MGLQRRHAAPAESGKRPLGVKVYCASADTGELEASVRQQGSTSSRLTTLARAETQNTSFSRLRSDSNLSSADGVEEKMLPHPVEPRARTAMLPAVLVCTE